jgi:hypothetical protein
MTKQKGGQRYLEELKKVPRRYAAIPVSFLLFESIRFGYRKMSSAFSVGKTRQVGCVAMIVIVCTVCKAK